MATAKPIASTPSPGARGRRARVLLLALVVLLAALLAWFWRPVVSYAVTSASYGSRMACSCRFIEGRELSDCGKDLELGMGLVTLTADDEVKSVTARFPLLSRQTTAFIAGQGCVPEKWGG